MQLDLLVWNPSHPQNEHIEAAQSIPPKQGLKPYIFYIFQNNRHGKPLLSHYHLYKIGRAHV